MFEINLLGSTFEKISRKEIQAFDMTGSRAPEVSKVFCFKALHAFTIVEAAKQLAGLKSWADRQNFPLPQWIGSGQCILRFFHGGTFYPYQLQTLLNVRMGHDTECRPLTIGKLYRPFRK